MSQHDEERAMERLYAARAEGPAPVSAPLDREGFLADLRKWFDRTIPATEAAIDYLNEDGWDDAKALHVRLLALSQQDQVGGPTPAVLGEPSADALRSEGDDAVGAAERDVGRYIYQRIETLMDAKHVTGIANELTYLATIAEAVEEYGSEACGGEDLSVFQGPPPPAGGVK